MLFNNTQLNINVEYVINFSKIVLTTENFEFKRLILSCVSKLNKW